MGLVSHIWPTGFRLETSALCKDIFLNAFYIYVNVSLLKATVVHLVSNSLAIILAVSIPATARCKAL